MGKHRRPKKHKFTILWGWWPGRKAHAVEHYRATHTNLWTSGEETTEVKISELMRED